MESLRNYLRINLQSNIGGCGWSKRYGAFQRSVGKIQDYTLYNDSENQRIYQNFIDAREGDIVIGYKATL